MFMSVTELCGKGRCRVRRTAPRAGIPAPPRYGRFMEADPIGFAGGMNLYAYVLNDPINLVDPSGLRWRCASVTVTQDGVTSGAGGSNCYDDNVDLLERLQNQPGGGGPRSFGGGGGGQTIVVTGTRRQSARRVICRIGRLAVAFGDIGTDAGQAMFVGGMLGGAVLGSDVGGVGALPGAIAGSIPGLETMGYSGALSSFGNLVMDVSGRNYTEGAVRFAINFGGGRVLHSIAHGGAISSFLSRETREYIADIYSEATARLVGRVISSVSSVDCESIN